MLRDPAPPAAAAQLGFVAGVALHDAAAVRAPRLAGRLKLKWPNDLLCAGRKIAGVLIEGEGNPLVVAVGIGVNCRHHPEAVEFHAATDFAAEGCDVGPEALFDVLAGAMAARLEDWNRGAGFAGIRTAWLERASGIGGHVEVRLAGAVTAGRFETIDAAGRLILRTPDGVVAVAAGDVFALDPARGTP
jgi:BirA family biotin operon repressor/biotin-[acetyl-CoA-carboxylase] ligase